MLKKIICLLLLFSLPVFGQKEGANWYFGQQAGLDFNSGVPVAQTDGQLNQTEGCATISTPTGELLFYTNGIEIYNADHQVMLNGSGLLGNDSSTQSSVIVPMPGNPDKYYVFAVAAQGGGDGLTYSVVDMTLDGGLGGVIADEKNILLITPVCEKITATRHANGEDVWIISHKSLSNEFIAYLLTADGISTTPVTSSLSVYHFALGTIGYLKASPDGKKIGCAITFIITRLELMDFDNATGVISNQMTINTTSAYGVEFSPDSKMLYSSAYEGALWQYDISSGSLPEILASELQLSEDGNHYGGLQLAIDGKIYAADPEGQTVSVINNPNESGIACNFQAGAIDLTGKMCQLGLPQFIQNYFIQEIKAEGLCTDNPTVFSVSSGIEAITANWDFGDGQTSGELLPEHIYVEPGIYTVTVDFTTNAGPDIIHLEKEITIIAGPEANAPEDMETCDTLPNDGFATFDLSSQNPDILDGQPAAEFTVNYYTNEIEAVLGEEPLSTGLYTNTVNPQVIYARVTNNETGCYSITTFSLIVNPVPTMTDPDDLIACEEEQGEGFGVFDLTEAVPQITGSNDEFEVIFYRTQANLLNNIPVNTPASYNNITPYNETIYFETFDTDTPDCKVTGELGLTVNPLPNLNDNITNFVLCDENDSGDGYEVFDLTTQYSAIANEPGLELTYSYEEAGELVAIANPQVFQNTIANQQTIFVSTQNVYTCENIASFDIIVNPLPVVNPDIPVFYECEETPGQGDFFLDDIDNVVTNNASGLTVAFYEELEDAENEAGNYISDSPYSSASKTIFARVEVAVTGCAVIVPVTLEVMPAPIADTPDPLEECDFNNDCFAFFNLDPVLEQIVTDMGNVEVSIYETEEDATFEQNVIPNTGSYQNIAACAQTLWIRVAAITGNTECFDIVQLQLIVNPVPEAVTPEPYEMCDNGVSDTDGEAIFDLTTLEAEILGTIDPALFTVTFHEDEQSAAAGTPMIPTPASYLSESTADAPIRARVTNNDTGCYDIVPVELIVNPLPVAIQPTPLTLCDDDIDDPEQEVFDLTTKIPEIILDQEGLDVTFHNSYEEADDNQNAIANPYEYVNNPPVETLFVRVTNAETGCYRIVLLDVRVAPLPIIEMPTEDDLTVCDTDGNGIGEFDLQALEEAMINNGADLSIAFYETAEDAVAGENPIPNTTTYHNIVPYNQTIYVIVSNSETGCTNSIPYELNLVVTPAPQAPALEDITDCDDQDNNGQNGMAFFDLTVQDQVILDALNAAPGELTIHYFIREDWANEGAPRITVPDHYMGSDEQTIWVRVEDPVSECYSITSFQLFLDLPLELTTPAPLAKCNEALPNDFQTVFNLREKDDEILGDLGIGQGYTVEYFESQAAVDANTPIANPEAYTNPVNPKTIFVVVTTDKGCRSYTTLTIRVLPLPVPDTTPDALELCDVNGNGDGIEVFDLTDAELDIRNNDFSAVVTYHVSLEDAENDANAIGTPDAYTSGNGFVWVRVEAATTNAADPVCYQVVQLELKIIALPPVGANGQITPYAICELSIDGIETFYLKDYIEGILGAGADTDYDIEFYFDQAALDNGTALPAIYENEVPFTQTIVVYVQHLETGCEITAPLTLIVRQQAVANTPDDIHYCDTDGTNDGLFTPIDLTQAEAGILDGQDDTLFDVTYYLTEQDATDDVNAIADPANFTNTEADLQVLWARVTNNQSQGQCFDVTSFSVVIERLPEPEIFTTPEGDNTVCIDFDGTIAKYLELHSGVTPNGHTYEWFRDGVAIADADPASGSYMAGEGGMYSVRVTSALGCISDISEEFEVIESGQASPIGAGYFVTNAFSDEQTITVLVQGNGVYEYQLDEDGLWQTSNIFVNVAPGSHTVTVRDVKTEFACAELVLDGVSVIDYPNFFTPNGDGFHDTWNLIGLADQTDAVVYIFDRYGKLIKQISTAGEGWDGTFNGQPAVSTDYWFTVTYPEFNGTTTVMREFKSHFSLKR